MALHLSDCLPRPWPAHYRTVPHFGCFIRVSSTLNRSSLSYRLRPSRTRSSRHRFAACGRLASEMAPACGSGKTDSQHRNHCQVIGSNLNSALFIRSLQNVARTIHAISSLNQPLAHHRSLWFRFNHDSFILFTQSFIIRQQRQYVTNDILRLLYLLRG